VHTSLSVTGKPAQFGRGVLSEVGGKLIGIFADNLAAMLAAEPAQAAPDEAEEEDATDPAGNGVDPAPVAAEESLPIDVLNLPVRAWNSLRRDGIQTLGDLVRRTPDQLLAIENIGPASVNEISHRLADRGLALAAPAGDSSAAEPDVPAARPGADDTLASSDPETAEPSAGPSGRAGAAERARANGSANRTTTPAPREPVQWQPNDEAIDLLGVAGLPVLKRAVPAAAGLLALVLVVIGVRRRRSRHR
jgi:hypothetical protein